MVKRASDLVTSTAGLIALILTPVLFRQKRVGRRARLFDILKFRSMHTGVRGTAITDGGDGRVTGIRRFLRRYKFDELPQLWNVFPGEMSLVRPASPISIARSSSRSSKTAASGRACTLFRSLHPLYRYIADLSHNFCPKGRWICIPSSRHRRLLQNFQANRYSGAECSP